jgi:hypothetical protein
MVIAQMNTGFRDSALTLAWSMEAGFENKKVEMTVVVPCSFASVLVASG